MEASVSKIEFLCDAIAEYAGSHDPRSTAYKLRNPLALKQTKLVPGEDGKKVIQTGEMRRFRSWLNGYEAALFDLGLKCSGRSQSPVTQYSSIRDLTRYYGMRDEAAKGVADYLSFALEDQAISPDTKLFVFLR